MSEKITIKNNIIIPGIGDDPRARELGEVLDVCSDEEIKKVVEEEEKREEKRRAEEEERKTKEREKREEEKKAKEREKKIESLMGNTKAILDDLKENHVQIEEDKKMMGYKGKIVHIDLPAVGNFKGYKFDYFVSNKLVFKRSFEKKPALANKSYSMKDISELLQAMNEYMKELNGENDRNMNYENKLRYRATRIEGCKAGDCLKAITGLNHWYWLKDKGVGWMKGSRAYWDCCIVGCHFDRTGVFLENGKLLLRLSD